MRPSGRPRATQSASRDSVQDAQDCFMSKSAKNIPRVWSVQNKVERSVPGSDTGASCRLARSVGGGTGRTSEGAPLLARGNSSRHSAKVMQTGASARRVVQHESRAPLLNARDVRVISSTRTVPPLESFEGGPGASGPGRLRAKTVAGSARVPTAGNPAGKPSETQKRRPRQRNKLQKEIVVSRNGKEESQMKQ